MGKTVILEDSLKILFDMLPKKTNPYFRLNSICPYYTMFPLNFPFKALKLASSNEKVSDPFCGRGTSNFAARLRNLSSVGIDVNPIASSITLAKFTNAAHQEAVILRQNIIHIGSLPCSPCNPSESLQSSLEEADYE